jgi:hypothetical protein
VESGDFIEGRIWTQVFTGDLLEDIRKFLKCDVEVLALGFEV